MVSIPGRANGFDDIVTQACGERGAVNIEMYQKVASR
jgi:hypothetical protein